MKKDAKKRVLLINSSSIYVKNRYCNKIFNEIQKSVPHVDLISYEVMREVDMIELSKHYSHIVITGTTLHDSSIDRLLNLNKDYSWIKKVKKPILGICAGHQIIGKVYGSILKYEKEKEKGKKYVKRIMKSELFEGIDEYFKIYQEHKDSISVPKSFVCLAQSKKCKNQVMAHKNKYIFGMQGHPEMSTKHGKMILKSFLNM